MVHVRRAWYVAAWSMDLAINEPFAVTIGNEPIVIYRTESGRLVAMEDRCAHRLAPLSRGKCEGEALRCMYHGFRFEPDGTCSEIPGQDKIPAIARVRTYPVADRHSWIWVWLGEPELADPDLIPPCVGFDNPDYILGRGQIDYAAEARLIHDNLCDLTHGAYTHRNSFNAGAEWSSAEATITVMPRSIRSERWVRNQKQINGFGKEELTDIWSVYEYHVPGVLLIPFGRYPAGTADALNNAPPPPEMPRSNVTFSSQATTMLTDKTSRYFFTWGPHKDHGDAALRDLMMQVAEVAFHEDKDMIEAQQLIIDADPRRNVIPTVPDKPVVMYQRVVERLLKEERASAPAASGSD